MLDPYTGDASEMGAERIERILRQRFGLIMAIQEAQNFAILIGEKPGQMRQKSGIKVEKNSSKTRQERLPARFRTRWT